ncbi:MAG TPA: DUF1905 domain-containing protein [Candidatus Binatia bacterium]|nr:DUF1905 domain-containing protein [Candidatus Binatia bacterium]
MKHLFKWKAKVWLYPGMASWHFITLPKKESEQIRVYYNDLKRGWGSLPVQVTVGKAKWKTSIFPDKKIGAYLLPIKSEVRKQAGITAGDTISYSLEVIA